MTEWIQFDGKKCNKLLYMLFTLWLATSSIYPCHFRNVPLLSIIGVQNFEIQILGAVEFGFANDEMGYI